MHVRYSDSFFATTATVTPVLLLALTLQGDFIARIFIGMIKAFAASLAVNLVTAVPNKSASSAGPRS